MHTQLHWLDVSERITYKLLGMLMYRCQHNKAPRNLMDHCTSVSDVAYHQRLRSASSHEVSVPRHRLSTWTSGICRCWPDCLELFARGHVGSWRFWGQLQTQAVNEDVFYLRITSVFSALEVFFTKMRYINPHLTLTLTLIYSSRKVT